MYPNLCVSFFQAECWIARDTTGGHYYSGFRRKMPQQVKTDTDAQEKESMRSSSYLWLALQLVVANKMWQKWSLVFGSLKFLPSIANYQGKFGLQLAQKPQAGMEIALKALQLQPSPDKSSHRSQSRWDPQKNCLTNLWSLKSWSLEWFLFTDRYHKLAGFGYQCHV